MSSTACNYRNPAASAAIPLRAGSPWAGPLFLLAAIFFAGFAYLAIRRGELSFFLANKALAVAAFGVWGSSFLLGPLRASERPWLRALSPRHFGWVAFWATIGHIALSLFVLGEKFPFPGWYIDHIISILFGLLSLAGLVLLVRASVRQGWIPPRLMGRISFLAFCAGVVHFGILKVPGCLEWLATLTPAMPPWSFFALIFSGVVIVAYLRKLIYGRRQQAGHAPGKSVIQPVANI